MRQTKITWRGSNLAPGMLCAPACVPLRSWQWERRRFPPGPSTHAHTNTLFMHTGQVCQFAMDSREDELHLFSLLSTVHCKGLLITEICSGTPDETATHASGLLACQAELIEFSSVVRSPERLVFAAIHYQVYLTGITVQAYLSGVPDTVWPT